MEIIKGSEGKKALSFSRTCAEGDNYLLPLTNPECSLSLIVPANVSARLEIINSTAEPLVLKGNIDLQEKASLAIVIVDFSASDVKAEISGTVLQGAKVTCDVASSARKTSHKIFDIRFDHRGMGSYSFVKMFGVLSDIATLSFLGTSKIEKGARKTWTRQEARIADLSKGGKGEASPVLLIDEDDVKASHGATLGKIPDEALFYLMSRGLSQDEAVGLITIGYLKPIVNEISDEAYKKDLLSFVEKREFNEIA
jgi:Fe-S cluster assembly protein SufD